MSTLLFPQLALIQLVRLFCYAILFYFLSCLVRRAIFAICAQDLKENSGKLFEWVGSWKVYALFALLWLPFLLIKYPGAMCWDSWHMLHTYRTGEISSHHSVFYSLVFGRLIDYFITLGHSNWGLFLFVGIHYLLNVLAAGMLVHTCMKLGLRKQYVILLVACIAINPYVLEYIGVAIKDSMYASLIVIFVAQLIDIVGDYQETAELGLFTGLRLSNALLLLVSGFLLVLVRKNGLYVIIATFFFSLIYGKKQCSRATQIILGILLVTSFACYRYLDTHIAVLHGNIREVLSIPFQQTARYVRDYENDVRPDEREIIDAILDYEDLAERYDPRISDRVKNKFDGDLGNLKRYFVVWVKQLFRHPICYLSATMEQNYYLFVPEAEVFDIVIYRDDDYGVEIGSEVIVSERTRYFEKLFYNPDYLTGMKSWVMDVFYALHFNPFVAAICNVSVAMYVFVLLLSIAFEERAECSLPFVPLVVSLLFVIVGPAVFGHPRYMFPVMFCLPMLICLVGHALHRRGRDDGLSEGAPAHLALNGVSFNIED